MTTIKLKRSTTTGHVPTLVEGEVAINEADSRFFYRDAAGAVASMSLAPFPAQCRFEYSSSSACILKPFGGNRLFINGRAEIIPSGGVTLGATGLSNTTLYYVYAYMNSGTMTLEAVTTVPVFTGFNVNWPTKTGAITRTLVGMVYRKSGAFVWDALGAKLVVSYWNRRQLKAMGPGTTAWVEFVDALDSAATEVNSVCRAEFLSWGDEDILASGGGFWNAAGCAGWLGVYLDAIAAMWYYPGQTLRWALAAPSLNVETPFSQLRLLITPSIGYHYASLAHYISWTPDASGIDCWYSGNSAAYGATNGEERTAAVVYFRG